MMLAMLVPRFYPILDTSLLERRGISPVDAARQILDAGARILQLRHKQFFSSQAFDQAAHIAELCRAANATFIVNDRADIAALLGAGVHLGQEDLAPSIARRILKIGMIGFSTHNAEQLRAAANEPADYLAIGPVFATLSKENPDPVLGVDELRRLRPLTDRRLVAIGGITRANAREVIAAGADSVAVISDLYPEDGNIHARAAEWVAEIAEHA
jgi:thiamine-phosphate pyrophosphorylase